MQNSYIIQFENSYVISERVYLLQDTQPVLAINTTRGTGRSAISTPPSSRTAIHMQNSYIIQFREQLRDLGWMRCGTERETNHLTGKLQHESEC
jgi:hypothetical protein